MKALNASFFGIKLSVSNDTLMTILLIVEAVICVLVIALLIYVLYRKKPKEAQEEPMSEPEPMPEPEPVPMPVVVPVAAEEPEEEFEWRPVKSFMAKYILSDDGVKARYGALKNAALGYEKMRSRISFKRETFYHGREALLRFSFRGKTLCMYFALDPAPFDGTKYHVENVADQRSYEDTPCMIRLTGSRKEKHAKELVAMLMELYGIPAVEREEVDYYLPVRPEDALLKEGLIKMVKVRRRGAPHPSSAPVKAAEAAVEEAASAEAEEVEEEAVPVVVEGEYELRMVKSFQAKYILADDEVKARYGALKNAALGYEKMRARAGFKRETLYHGREALLRFSFRGKKLCMFFALDPASFEGTIYHVEDVSDTSAYADTPCMIRLTGSRKEKHAKELIGLLMESRGIAAVEREEEDYYLPAQTEEELLREGLIKQVRTPHRSAIFKK